MRLLFADVGPDARRTTTGERAVEVVWEQLHSPHRAVATVGAAFGHARDLGRLLCPTGRAPTRVVALQHRLDGTRQLQIALQDQGQIVARHPRHRATRKDVVRRRFERAARDKNGVRAPDARGAFVDSVLKPDARVGKRIPVVRGKRVHRANHAFGRSGKVERDQDWAGNLVLGHHEFERTLLDRLTRRERSRCEVTAQAVEVRVDRRNVGRVARFHVADQLPTLDARAGVVAMDVAVQIRHEVDEVGIPAVVDAGHGGWILAVVPHAIRDVEERTRALERRARRDITDQAAGRAGSLCDHVSRGGTHKDETT
ncbi:MAG: hypothetical protein IPK26_10370 [Planctomycetes bacterium]|nr:hypothetical protein [Planctomycetota bacterium]